jgi:prepilin-type N-terminal cleavage/methylation domain-containing protein
VHHVLMLRRRGFSIAELMISMTILGVLGAIFTRIIVSQSRFTDQQNAMRGARTVSRQAMNILSSEIRMVQDSGGIDSASTDGKVVRLLVPYRMGINCGVTGTRNVVSMLPIDSLTLAQAVYAGYAWRSPQGNYTVVVPADPSGADRPVTAVDATKCTGSGTGEARVRTLSMSGRSGQVLDITPTAPDALQGQIVFFYQRIIYKFAASTAFPGKIGLWRIVQGGATDELMAPFDTAARFKYWTSGATASVAAPPALPLIRGLDVVLAAESRYTPAGKKSPLKSTVVASLFFRNVRSQ